MQRRALTAALASAALVGGGLASTATTAQADETASPLRVTAPDRVVVRSYEGNYIYSSLGVRMVAQNEDFVVHAKRPEAYDGPITATWIKGDETVPDVNLGEMSTWQGLDGFGRIKILRDGQRIRLRSTTGCLNGSARRVGPAGPVTNPFPWGCPWNPYTLGSVMGVARDYSTTLLPEWGTQLRLPPGTYQLVAGISPAWRDKLGISDADGEVTTELVVRPQRERFRALAERPRRGTDDLDPPTGEPGGESGGEMDPAHAPDLRSLPAFDVSLNERGTALRFGATVWNGGRGPMVIEGFRDSRAEDHMAAYQYYFDEHGEQTGFQEVGEFHYHAANHNHWHFEDFARYRLFAPDPANPDEPGEVAVRSTKQSFCLVATDAVDLTVDNADMRPEYTDLGSQCGGPGALSLREVLANGHGDTYHQYRAGQAFRIGNLPDGDYFISVEANPDDANGRNLLEGNLTNNDSFRKVKLWTTPRGVRKVEAYQVGIIEEFPFEGFFRMR